MKDRLVLLAVLVAAALLGALLVANPRRALKDIEEREDPGRASISSSGAPAPIPLEAPPRPSASAIASASASPTALRPPPLPPYVHVDPASATACGAGMVLVDGIYCPYVGHSCVQFLNEEHDVCQRYAEDVICEGRLQHRRYCVDVFEYPNLEGVVPAVMVDWNDAKRACAVEGKRLCTVEEWEFACEGPQMWPYPYGVERDPTACNIDRTYTLPEMESFSDPLKISEEVERLDKRVPSGALARCISPFGARDMTGNVDEWVFNENGKGNEKPFRSTLKGGYWGPIRARCRPITSTHNEWFSFYQVGFRCCRDADGKAVEPAPAGARVPRRQRMETAPPRPTP